MLQPARRRVAGIDAARALAIIGMVMVHFGPVPVVVDDPLSFVYASSYGRASVLFVVLAGVGVSFMAGDRSPGGLRRTDARLATRAAVLFMLGVGLALLPTNVAVILHYYALYFLIAGVGVRLPDRWLLVAALLSALVGPLALLLTELNHPGWFALDPQASLAEPQRLLRALVVTGYYPALTWAAPVLFGVWLGRLDLAATRVGRRLAVGGAAVAVVVYLGAEVAQGALGAPSQTASWRDLLDAGGHTEMPLSIVGATAVATAVLGAMVQVIPRLPRLTWPLVATGQLALTVYVAQLLVLATAPELLERATVEAAAGSVARFVAVVVAGATVWRWWFARGPVEVLLHLPVRRPSPPRPLPPGREHPVR